MRLNHFGGVLPLVIVFAGLLNFSPASAQSVFGRSVTPDLM